MSKSKKSLDNSLRQSYMDKISKALVADNEEVLLISSHEFAIPCVNEEGDDEYIVISFKVPQGSRDGTPFDGHLEAEVYGEKVKADAEKAKANAEKKAKKIALDAKMREEKAKLKAEREKVAK